MKEYIKKIHLLHVPSLVVLCIVLLGLLFIQKLYFRIVLKEHASSQNIQAIIENNFKKAIQFGDVSITLAGNIVLKDVKIAPTTDFNDNYNFISCKKAVIDLSYFKAITGKIQIKGVSFSDAMITLVKNYGKGYIETFQGVSNGIEGNEYINLDDFYMEAKGDIIYNENLSNDKLKLNIKSSSLAVNIKNKVLWYSIKGIVTPVDSSLDNGKIHIKGQIIFSQSTRYESSRHWLYIKKLDMHVANYFIKEYTDWPFIIRGYFYTDSTIRHDNNYSFEGSVECDNCTIENIKSVPHYEVLSKDNISVTTKIECKEDLSDITISHFKIDDREISINANFHYQKGKVVQYYLETNTIDLEDCYYIQLSPELSYDGSLHVLSECNYDIANGIMKSFKVIFDAKNVAVEKKIKNASESLVKNLQVKVNGNEKAIHIDFSGRQKKSDFSIHSSLHIIKWSPFSTVTDITFKSKKLFADLVVSMLSKGIASLFYYAMEDMSIGWNDIFFRQKPLGQFLINNTLKLTIDIEKLFFDKNAYVNNIKADIISNKGSIATQSFNCEGYSAQYSFGINGFCNSDYPSITIFAGIANFDYGKFLSDTGRKIATGIMNASLNYSVSGYRLSHLLQNANGLFQVTIANTLLDNTFIQKKIAEIAQTCGVYVNVGQWQCKRLDITINHIADRWVLQNLFIDTDAVQLGGYGNYSIDKGLSLPCYATIYINEGPVIKGTQRINFTIGGTLDNPVIVTGAPCPKKEILLFDVN